MRPPVLVLLFTIPALLLPVGAAGPLGQLDSDAPIKLFGDASAGGSDLWLYHHVFEAGSFTGVLYSGSIVDVEHRSQDPCFGGAPYREETRTLASVSGATPEPISFALDPGTLGLARFGDESNAPAGSGDALDSERPDATPTALVGPNPYATDEPESSFPYGPEYVRAFPLDPFLVIPTGPLRFPFSGEVVVEIGNISIVQAGQDRTFRSATTQQTANCSPAPNLPFPPPSIPVYHRLEIRAASAVLDIKQGPLERTLSWYDGSLAPDPSTTPAQDGEARMCSHEPRGYVVRRDPEQVAEVAHRCALPATSYSSRNLTSAVEGIAVFETASGLVAAGYEDRPVDAQTVTLTGNLELTPVAVEEEGRRMRTDIGGSVFMVNSPEAPAANDDWMAYASGAAGGALLLGVVLYSWPILKWRFALLAAPLYARLKKDEILENPLRDDILAHVQETPGISASELGRRVECGWGTLVYHLTVLERMQLVSSAREGRHKRFFAQGRINYSDKGAVGLLANPAARTILDAIRTAPGAIQKDLSERLNLSPGTIAWHVERLAAEGLVIKEDEGRTVRYYPSERLLQLTQRLAA